MRCYLCPVVCGVDREAVAGHCSVKGLKIAKYYLHPYEEPPISYKNGSGCIFFCGCSLRCAFCQNYELSRAKRGKTISVQQLAEIFQELEEQGAENINLVTPTHYSDQILKAFTIYRPKIPVVYNTHSYERVEKLKELDEYIDIYLPDLKFMDSALAKRYTGREDYASFALPAIRFMAQKPFKEQEGKMLSGCIVRHLILPMAASDSIRVVEFVKTLPPETRFSLMSQYTPFGDIERYPELQRKITKREYQRVLDVVKFLDVKHVFLQDHDSASEQYIPKWDY